MNNTTRPILREALAVVLSSTVLSLAAAYISVRVMEAKNIEQDRRLEKIEEEHSAVLKTVTDIARDIGYIRGSIEAHK